jgi:hypothetical protein
MSRDGALNLTSFRLALAAGRSIHVRRPRLQPDIHVYNLKYTHSMRSENANLKQERRYEH